MRGVKRCQESTGRMKKHRYSNEFKVTAVKMANFNNHHRLQSGIDYHTPEEYERLMA